MDQCSLEETFEHIGFGRFHYLLVFICGILQSFDAIEMLILAFLQPILKCVWQSTLFEESLLITGVFVGMMFGGPILGRLCDIFGRKYILMISSFSLAYFGLIASAAPSILWLTVLRIFIGAFLGGVMSSLATLASELMPIKNRGSALITILAFWPIGSYLISILCITVVPAYGWRSFLAISTLPILLSLPLLLWLPESPRFLILKNRKEEAIEILNKISRINRSSRILQVNELSRNDYSCWDIFHPNYLSTTLIISFLWFVSALTYYGIILIVTSIDRIPRQCLQNTNSYSFYAKNSNTTVDDSCCTMITWSNSLDTIISTTGEIVFIPITLLMINIIGRKYSMVILGLLIAVLFVILNVCMPPLVMSILLFVTRGAISSNFNINYIYTSEVFPTSVRSSALGMCNTGARLGAMMSPFIVNFVFMRSSFVFGTMIFTFINLVAFIGALMLPYETKGRPLFQTAEEYSMRKEMIAAR